MTTLEKVTSGSAGSNHLSLVKSAMAKDTAQGRQEFTAQGKNMPSGKAASEAFEAKKKEVEQAVKSVSSYVQNITRELNFSVDEELGSFVVKVIDLETGKEIRQIPTEDMLDLAKSLAEAQDKTTRGILFQGDA